MTTKRIFGLAACAALAASALIMGACGGDDDDNGDADREAASDLTARFENFKRDLGVTADIEQAPDGIKDGLKDDCAQLQDEIDSDKLDEFCTDLGDAIDDESQSEYTAVRARFGTDVEAELSDEIADRLNDAGENDAGGDPGDDDDDSGAGDDNGIGDDNDGDESDDDADDNPLTQ